MKKKKYEAPQTKYLEVELEQGFMVQGSMFKPDEGHDKGLTIEEHGFANPGAEWEGDYTTGDNAGWDK